MSLLLEDKTAVIYAAGGAIGGAVARAFAREGARLFLTGRDLAKLDAVAEDVVAAGGVAETARVDALDENAVEEHLADVVERAGGVDVSFNAIGPGPAPERLPLTELGVDAFARPIAFYTRSNFVTATAAARHMSGHGSGVILTLTAVPGRLPARLIGGAAPAWAAVEAFSRSLAAGGRAGRRPGGLPARARHPGDPAHRGELRDGERGRRRHARRVPDASRTGNGAEATPDPGGGR